MLKPLQVIVLTFVAASVSCRSPVAAPIDPLHETDHPSSSGGGDAPLGSSAKSIVSFSIAPTLNGSCIGEEIAFIPDQAFSRSFKAEVPATPRVSSLIPSFTVSPGASLSVMGTALRSGIDPVDFSGPVVCRVTAEDGSYADFTIRLVQTEPRKIRVMAANLSSGNNAKYDQGHGLRIIQGCAPDVVLLQHFLYLSSSEADYTSFATKALFPDGISAKDAYYCTESNDSLRRNGIVSRYRIIESGEWIDSYTPNRDFLWARIDIPGPIDLWAISVHLITSPATTRTQEAAILLAKIREVVPPSDYLVIGGTLNVASMGEDCLATLAPVATSGSVLPSDGSGGPKQYGTDAARSKTLDLLLVNVGLGANTAPTVIGAASFPHGLVVDTRVFAPLSDISPALAGDSSAPDMLHMGVLKDFYIPGH